MTLQVLSDGEVAGLHCEAHGGSCVQISVGQHRRQTSPFMEMQAHITGYQAACAAVTIYLNFRCTVEHVESSRSPSRKEWHVMGH